MRQMRGFNVFDFDRCCAIPGKFDRLLLKTSRTCNVSLLEHPVLSLYANGRVARLMLVFNVNRKIYTFDCDLTELAAFELLR
jgi:hypothetical protein